MATPASASQPVLAARKRGPGASIARTVQYAAATSSTVSSASGLSKRNINAATGVAANAAPASRPAPGPLHRRTAAYSRATEPTPIKAWGASSDHEPKPNSRPDSPITHRAAGGLSTVIALPASCAPNSSAFQLCVPACAAAA